MLFNKKAIVLAVIGFCLVIIGTVLAVCWPDFFKRIMKREMHLTPNSRTYEMWKSPPIPMYIDIYFFNWTNPEELRYSKPVVDEVGPYRFREIPDKVNISWHSHNSTVSFKKKSNFYFDEENSNGSLDDVITTLNIVALAAAAQSTYWDSMRRGAVSVGLTVYGEDIHVTKTANELLFEGYESSLIEMAKAMPSMSDHGVPFDRFGWFYTRNGSADLMGHYNMATGVSDISEIGVVKQWNYGNTTKFFPGTCGMVNGSAGEFYPPDRTKEDSVSFFSADLCRTLTLDYEKEVEVEGIKGYKYSGGERTVDNGTKYPENACFCNGECVPSGTLNISACRFGTPVFMSFPHYYQGDPFYLTQVDGLKPEEDKHSFYMTLEPSTGIALDVAARFQVNILLEPHEGISLYSDIPKIFFPVLWFEQRVSISPTLAAGVRHVVYIPSIGQACAIILIFVGFIMILWVPVAVYFKHRKAKAVKLQKRSSIVKGGCSKPTKSDIELNMGKDGNLEPLLSSKPIIPVTSNNGALNKPHSDNGKLP